MSRPEHQAPPEIYYNDTEAQKYTSNTRNQEIQAEMTLRAIELLALPEHRHPALIMDIGCGSGLSGEILTESGHEWVGFDISPSMLSVGLERDVEGDMILADAGHGCMFRPGSFDGAISISVLQWLCNADTSYNSPAARLSSFFTTLYASLTRGARCVFQFYPESDDQVTFIMSQATRAGFGGGLVVDYPNSVKAKKIYLVLWVGGEMLVGPNGEGQGVKQTLPAPLDFDEAGSTVLHETRKAHDTRRDRHKKSKKIESSRQFIQRKKEINRSRGKMVRLQHSNSRNRMCRMTRNIQADVGATSRPVACIWSRRSCGGLAPFWLPTMRHHGPPPVIDETSTFVGLLKEYSEHQALERKNPIDPAISKQLEAAASWTREAYVIVRLCCAHLETTYILAFRFLDHDTTSILGYYVQK